MTETTVDTRDLSLLEPEFRCRFEVLLKECAARGFEMVPYSVVRTPWDQARIWRSTRATSTIRRRIGDLRESGQKFLAQCIEDVGPQRGSLGNHVTWVIPGYSWHNWGEAVDCYWKIDGRASWTTVRTITVSGSKINGYKAYAEIAESMGLYSGGVNWGMDWPHVHKQGFDSPGKVMSPREINDEMEKRWG